uniref:Uncharacterized protein n=1 Tax=Rhizophora mucronata TaxID=61149 RepID=A0A2P2K276_RHIMU
MSLQRQKPATQIIYVNISPTIKVNRLVNPTLHTFSTNLFII